MEIDFVLFFSILIEWYKYNADPIAFPVSVGA